jgi:cytochrome b561
VTGVTYLKNRKLEFWLTLLLLLATIISSIAAYIFWYKLTFFIGSYLFIHWLSMVATAFVAVSIPIQYFLKRKRPQNFKKILQIHTFGNVIAFWLISIHFAQNVGRLAGAIQRLGLGFAMYPVLSLIVATGILERYQSNEKLSKYIKIIHKYVVIIMYVLILLHILEALNILL